jgi:hypothetical protein
MASRLPSLSEIQWRTLQALQASEGTLWKEARGELIGSEVASWILLFEDSDPRMCHLAYERARLPFAADAEAVFTVGYYVFREGMCLRFAWRDSQHIGIGELPETIEAAFAEMSARERRRNTVAMPPFRATDSRRP